ncbi:MAG: transglycosylase SLT domain-containing protein [Bacteroidales bacterium]|jgi:membrane-bound lytic murein transglycosylase D|nr:transglycosylase SLT domain-containing protein [Bacteroidales bacterium]
MKIHKLLILLILFTISTIANAQVEDTDEVIRNFETNYDSLLNSFHIRRNTHILNKEYHSSAISLNAPKASQTEDSILAKRLRAIPSDITLSYNPKVRRYIETYVDKMPTKLSVMLGLSKYYFPLFEGILDKYGVPVELKYLVVIESALNPDAVSRRGATGLWQFMYSTAKLWDLRMNSVIDERKDPIKSTEAAAKYLKSLYRIYNDWTLALAAYNCGPGNVNKALRRSNGKDFWAIYDYLPRETRGYVPAFIGAAYAFNYYREHGINACDVSLPVATDTVTVTKDIHFGQLATVMQIDYDMLKDLNPQYKKFAVPGTQDFYTIKLPTNYICRYISLEDSIANYEKDKYFGDKNSTIDLDGNSTLVYKDKLVYHKVRKNETWASIARRYGVGVSELKAWNPKSAKRKSLQIGTSLAVKQQVAVKVEKPDKVDSTATQTPFTQINETTQLANSTNDEPQITSTTDKPQPKQSIVKHVVTKGDTIYSLAKKYNVPASHILSLNNLKNNNPVIRIGQTLRIK